MASISIHRPHVRLHIHWFRFLRDTPYNISVYRCRCGQLRTGL